MICIICNEPADKSSIYFPGEKTKLIAGKTEPGETIFFPFGICSDHLDEQGEFLAGVEDQIKKNILNRVREGNVPEVDTLEGFEDLGGLI